MTEDKRGYRKAVRVLIFNEGNLLLGIIKHKNGGISYTLPGGGIEGNETPEEAAIKECLEEVGVEIVDVTYLNIDHKYPKRFWDPRWSSKWRGVHDKFFKAKYLKTNMSLFNIEGDGMEHIWVTLQEAEDLIRTNKPNHRRDIFLKVFSELREDRRKLSEW